MLRNAKRFIYVTVANKLKMTFRNIIIILFFPLVLFGQNNEPNIETLNKISRIMREVAKINLTEKDFNEGRAEGPMIYKSIFRKNGGWTAYFLYKNQKDNPPLRIKYSQTAKRGFEDFEFYYENGELIFAKLNVTINRGQNKGNQTERLFYFNNSDLIYATESDKEKYAEYINRTEKSVRKMIYE